MKICYALKNAKDALAINSHCITHSRITFETYAKSMCSVFNCDIYTGFGSGCPETFSLIFRKHSVYLLKFGFNMCLTKIYSK